VASSDIRNAAVEVRVFALTTRGKFRDELKVVVCCGWLEISAFRICIATGVAI
jgi:hypothetical protein